MDLLIADGSVPLASADLPPGSGTPQYATDGNPALNIPGTVWPSYWLNGLMRELMALLTAGGITPNRTVYTQLRDALQAMFGPGQLVASSGYIKLPKVAGTSLILQWVTYSLTPNQTTNCPAGSTWGTQAVTWPIAFTNTCFNAWAAPNVTNNGQYTFGATAARTLVGCDVYHNAWATASFPVLGSVLTIGY
jgi:hypothetical protein